MLYLNRQDDDPEEDGNPEPPDTPQDEEVEAEDLLEEYGWMENEEEFDQQVRVKYQYSDLILIRMGQKKHLCFSDVYSFSFLLFLEATLFVMQLAFYNLRMRSESPSQSNYATVSY